MSRYNLSDVIHLRKDGAFCITNLLTFAECICMIRILILLICSQVIFVIVTWFFSHWSILFQHPVAPHLLANVTDSTILPATCLSVKHFKRYSLRKFIHITSHCLFWLTWSLLGVKIVNNTTRRMTHHCGVLYTGVCTGPCAMNDRSYKNSRILTVYSTQRPSNSESPTASTNSQFWHLMMTVLV
jgi:hypothetical protein